MSTLRRLVAALAFCVLPLVAGLGAFGAVTAIYWVMNKIGEPRFSYMVLAGLAIVMFQEIVREGAWYLRAKLKKASLTDA